jgi:hypothetical protein
MTYSSTPSSVVPLLTLRLSALDGEPSRSSDALRGEAERCFRLAQGIASFELADELEAIGRAFESEAEELEAEPHRSSVSRWSSPLESRAA